MPSLLDQIAGRTSVVDEVLTGDLEDGERLALVSDRNMAFVLARQNEFSPVAVH